MTELEESISRLNEVEHQLRSVRPFSRVPDQPWEWAASLADDVAKVKEFLARVNRRM